MVRIIIAALMAVTLYAQAPECPRPQVVQKNGHFAPFVHDAPYLMLVGLGTNFGAEPVVLRVSLTTY